LVGSFDECAFLEAGAGSDQSHEVEGVDGTPAGLCGLDELERHQVSVPLVHRSLISRF
jgi:hypothetical protein